MTGRVVIAGSLAQRPRIGGHTWVFLQYLLGFKRLGWDVLFLDRLEPDMCVDAAGRPCPLDRSVNLHYFMEIMQRFGLNGAFALVYNNGERFVGLSRRQVLERTKDSAFLLNFMGYLTDEEILGRAPRRVFLDIDPGFGQMWQDLGLADLFQGHDDFVTIGENIGHPACTIPSCGLKWIVTPQPVVLDYWQPRVAASGDWFTSIASWRGAYGPVEYRGETYGLRVHEFRKFASLPRLSGRLFQSALDIHPAEVNDLALLTANGWSLVDPQVVAGDPWTYQAYIQGSKAEFMVAKNIYVQANSGWFSDRSICYLASGKPVLAQDTGLGRLYPTGEGLLTFT
ncbi:MAG: hypothetical protein AVDCRST_MAG93-5302, partial [uncultured Chloroflexia bacterium]